MDLEVSTEELLEIFDDSEFEFENLNEQNELLEDFNIENEELLKNSLDCLSNDVFDTEKSPLPQHLHVLQKYFRHKEFKPMQWKIIYSVLYEKRDNLAVLSTGYGKSICYQYPAVYTNGVTLVISPLISLMEDQVLRLNMHNIPACFLGSGQKEKNKIMCEMLEEKKFRIIYLTPELLMSEYGEDLLRQMKAHLNIVLVAIDEAHCVSQWGHDFRGDYSKLSIIRAKLLPDVPILAATATATQCVSHDIVASLKLRSPQIVRSGVDRPNLYFSVKVKTGNAFSDLGILLERCANTNKSIFHGSTIIYCITRAETETMSQELRGRGIECESYHAGMTVNQRKRVHEKFVKDELKCICATIAFGMGIDKADVRNVIHYGASCNVESYYQEVGRAGRDGQPAKCTVFYYQKDFAMHKVLAQRSWSSKMKEYKEKSLNIFKKYLNTLGCRRQFIVNYFNGEAFDLSPVKKPARNCCDNCDKAFHATLMKAINPEGADSQDDYGQKLHDFTKETDMLLRAIDVMKGKFGIGLYLLFLRGSKCSKLHSRFYSHALHGAGKSHSENWWKAFAELLEQNGYLKKTAESFNKFIYLRVEVTTLGYATLDRMKRGEQLQVKLQPTLELMKQMNIRTEFKPLVQTKSEASTSSSQATTSTSNESLKESMEEKELRAELFKQLGQLRNTIAAELDQRPFMIASNVDLMQIARYQPTTLQELEKCQFDKTTAAKIRPHFDRFVELMKKHQAAQEADRNPKIIKKILEKHPLFSKVKLDENDLKIYYTFKDQRSIQKTATISHSRTSSVESGILRALQVGYPIKLSDLGVSRKNMDIVTKVFQILEEERDHLMEDYPQRICKYPVVKFLSPFEIHAITSCLLIRKHLKSLKVLYDEHEELLGLKQTDDEIPAKRDDSSAFTASQGLSKLIEIGEKWVDDVEQPEEQQQSTSKSIAIGERKMGSQVKENTKPTSTVVQEKSTMDKKVEVVDDFFSKIMDSEMLDAEEKYFETSGGKRLNEEPNESVNEVNEAAKKKIKVDIFVKKNEEKSSGDNRTIVNINASDIKEEDFEGFFDSSPENEASEVEQQINHEAQKTHIEASLQTKDEGEDYVYSTCLLDSPPSRRKNKDKSKGKKLVTLDMSCSDSDPLDINVPFHEPDATDSVMKFLNFD